MKQILHLLLVLAMLECSSAVLAELPTNNDPKRQIRFVGAEEATARREKLIRFIWPAGLPDCRPTITKDVGEAALKKHLKGVDSSLVKRIDRLELEVLGIDSLAYIIHPVKNSDRARLAIVHAGHSRPGDFIKRDYHDSIHLFHQAGLPRLDSSLSATRVCRGNDAHAAARLARRRDRRVAQRPETERRDLEGPRRHRQPSEI
jgi:hypothetical protein